MALRAVPVNGNAASLLNVMESHRHYPILRYFHFHDARNSLPRLLFLTLDTATLVRSALDPDQYRAFVDSSAVTELWYGVLDAVHELSSSLLGKKPVEHRCDRRDAWRRRYMEAVDLLGAAGIRTAPGRQEGADCYVALRGQWEPYLAAIAAYLAYDWSAIAPREAGKDTPILVTEDETRFP